MLISVRASNPVSCCPWRRRGAQEAHIASTRHRPLEELAAAVICGGRRRAGGEHVHAYGAGGVQVSDDIRGLVAAMHEKPPGRQVGRSRAPSARAEPAMPLPPAPRFAGTFERSRVRRIIREHEWRCSSSVRGAAGLVLKRGDHGQVPLQLLCAGRRRVRSGDHGLVALQILCVGCQERLTSSPPAACRTSWPTPRRQPSGRSSTASAATVVGAAPRAEVRGMSTWARRGDGSAGGLGLAKETRT